MDSLNKKLIAVSNIRKRKNLSKNISRKNFRTILFGVLILIVAATAITTIYISQFYSNITANLPSVRTLETLLEYPNATLLQPTIIYDRNSSTILFELDNTLTINQNYLTLEQIPQALINSFVTANDPNYWDSSNFSIEYKKTIPNILVEDLLLWGESETTDYFEYRSNLLASQAVNRFGKEKILEWFLNYVIMGNFTNGVEEASIYYFGKPAMELNLAESAMLAAISLNPNFNPTNNSDIILERQSQILRTMVEVGYITEEEAKNANNSPITINQTSHSEETKFSGFRKILISQLESQIGNRRMQYGGLIIISTLDTSIQNELDCTTETYLNQYGNISGYNDSIDNCSSARLLPTPSNNNQFTGNDLSVDAVVIDSKTGQILGFDGDPNPNFHTGTIISPFVYLSGFTRGMGPATLLWDIPYNLPQSKLYDELEISNFEGPVNVRFAVLKDLLAPMYQTYTLVGYGNVLNILNQLGFSSSLANNPSQSDVIASTQGSIINLTHAYSMLSNQGTLSGHPLDINEFHNSFSPTTILFVKDYQENILVNWSQPQIRPIINSQLAYLMTNILSDESNRKIVFGHPNLYEIGGPVAVKNGYSLDHTQSWTVGYSTEYVVGVRVGTNLEFSNPESLGVWHAISKSLNKENAFSNFEEPSGIRHLVVCNPSGLLPTTNCEKTIEEIFIQGNEPNLPDNLYQSILINQETGLLATVFTPPELVEEKIYIDYPPEALDWAIQTNKEIPPTNYDSIITTSQDSGNVSITSPLNYSYLANSITITGNVLGDNLNYFKVQVGEGLNPRQWLQIGEDQFQQISEGKLGTWDSTNQNGLYSIQIIAVYGDQSIETSTIHVTVDNTPPSIELITQSANQITSYTSTDPITIQANVVDNIGLGSVTLSSENTTIKTFSDPPYIFPYIGNPGLNNLKIIAEDLAGNIAEIEFVIQIEE